MSLYVDFLKEYGYVDEGTGDTLADRLAAMSAELKRVLDESIWLSGETVDSALPEASVFDRHGNRIGSIGEDGIIDV